MSGLKPTRVPVQKGSSLRAPAARVRQPEGALRITVDPNQCHPHDDKGVIPRTKEKPLPRVAQMAHGTTASRGNSAAVKTRAPSKQKAAFDPTAYAKERQAKIDAAARLREERKKKQAEADGVVEQQPEIRPAQHSPSPVVQAPQQLVEAAPRKQKAPYDPTAYARERQAKIEAAAKVKEERKRKQAEAASLQEAAARPSPRPPQGQPAGEPFSVGSAVQAQFGDSEWFSAQVTACNGNGTFDVLFDDGYAEAGMPARKVRSAGPASTTIAVSPREESGWSTAAPSPQAPPPCMPEATATGSHACAVGAAVEALFGDTEYFAAIVKKCNADGSYDILFEDGYFQAAMPENKVRSGKAVREPSPPPPARSDSRKPQKKKSQAAAARASSPPIRASSPPIRASSPPLRPTKAAVEAPDPRSLAATGGSVRQGARLEAQFANGEWYDAAVTKCNADGSYDVLFDDGFAQAAMPAEKLRDPNAPVTRQQAPVEAPPPSATSPPIRAASPPLRSVACVDELPLGGGMGGMSGVSELPPEQPEEDAGEMAECPECGRKMRAAALSKHMNIHKERKKFNSKARMVNKEARSERKNAIKSGVYKSGDLKPESKGAEQSRLLREAMKAERDYQKEQKKKMGN